LRILCAKTGSSNKEEREEKMKYRVGVDIWGGDFAPQEIIKGSILAKKEIEEEIILIGAKEEIKRQITLNKFKLEEFKIIDAPQKIEMADSPVSAIRKKKDSSIVVGVNLLKEKKIDAFVSCGNTGAVVSASTLILGMIEGIERPGIGIIVPTQKDLSLVIDVGANIGPRPLHLLQYGIMASVYYSLVFNKENPTVGLLNIGEEESKGPESVKYVHKIFSLSPLNFIGYIEAKDIFSGRCNCIICDGFIGNIALKVSESFAEFMGKSLLETVKKDTLGKLGIFLIKRSLKKLKRITDYTEYGGAPLLGVNGIVIIGHGRSNAYAVKNAIKVAIQELNRDLNVQIKRRVNEICQNSRIRQILTS
jgi:glycerol-3-phosphate acyltransferase PlsX